MHTYQYLKNVTTLQLDSTKCTGCQMCMQVCPHAVFELAGKKVMIKAKDNCMECGACARNCQTNALSVRSGVGCSGAIIQGLLRGSEPSCDCACSSKPKNTSCC